MRHRRRFALTLALSFAASASSASAAPQLAAEGRVLETVATEDTGWVAAPASGAETVAAFHVVRSGATWMRLFFTTHELPAGAYLRLTSLADGAVQRLDADEIERWSGSSAYFNGDVVQVEVVAAAGAGPSRVAVARVRQGVESHVLASICGADERAPTADPRVARLLPSKCTGFLIDDDCGCLLTAGHCMNSSTIVQFNVPASSATGALRHPAPQHQYPVDPASVQGNGGQGYGDDWAYFGVEVNGTTGLTAKDSQGPGFTFATPPVWSSGQSIRITGYGIASGTLNQTLQTNVGPWLPFAGGTMLEHGADTKGGNSGSPVIHEASGVAMGIHTHGGCQPPTAGNKATASTHAALQAALANPLGVCAKAGIAGSLAARNGTGLNPLCFSSPSVPLVGSPWSMEVDTSVHPGAQLSIVQGRLGGTSGAFFAAGELLIDLGTPLVFQTVLAASGGKDVHAATIPADPVLGGRSAALQGLVLGSGAAQLCNALDVTLECPPEICGG